MIAALLLLTALAVRSVSLSAGAAAPVVIRCPQGATTRIVFPEPVVATFSPSAQVKLGLAWERGNASKVALVRPSEHPAQGLLRFTGKRFGQFTLRLETVSAGDSAEVRLAVPPKAEAPLVAATSSASHPGAPAAHGRQPIKKDAATESRVVPTATAKADVKPPGPSKGSPARAVAQPAVDRALARIPSPAELVVEVRNEAVSFENKTAAAIPATQIVLVAADGTRFVPRDGMLAPTWATLVPFSRFAPPLTGAVRIARVELEHENTPSRPQPQPTPRADAPAAAPPTEQIRPAAAPAVVPNAAVTHPAAAGHALLDPEIFKARVRPVGRVEALPGQRQVELADILEAENFLWLRFNVRGGARARVEDVSWEHGPIESYTTELANKGKDLLVVVQLPKARTTKRTRVTLRLDDGPRKFPLSAPWLSSLVKDLLGF